MQRYTFFLKYARKAKIIFGIYRKLSEFIGNYREGDTPINNQIRNSTAGTCLRHPTWAAPVRQQKKVVISRTPTGCAAHLESTFARFCERQSFYKNHPYKQVYTIFFVKILYIPIFCSTFVPKFDFYEFHAFTCALALLAAGRIK